MHQDGLFQVVIETMMQVDVMEIHKFHDIEKGNRGGVDTTVPPHHGSEYSERALSAGDRVEHRVIPRADHFELVAPWTAGGQEVEGAIREFLNGVRRLPPSARGSP